MFIVRRAKLCGFALLIHTSGLVHCQVAPLMADDGYRDLFFANATCY